MSKILDARRGIRRKINRASRYDRFLHLFVTIVLAVNVVLILYVMLSVTLNMTLSGVGLVDSLPIVLYILPLMILLPLMTIAYYRERTAAWNFAFLIICSVFFGVLSSLIRGFLLCLLLNIIAAVVIFLLGRFRPKSSLRQAGKKGLAYILLLNLLGLTFPVSIVLMGQNPIAISGVEQVPQISLSMPLSSFDYPYREVVPSTELLSDISANSFDLDFRVLENDTLSWSRLRDWLVGINETEISYSITLTPNYGNLAENPPSTLATTELIEHIYRNHRESLSYLMNLTLSNIVNMPLSVVFDMTLPRQEWQALMLETRSLDLIGFSGLMRASLYSVDLNAIEYEASQLHEAITSSGVDAGVLVEPFVVDDSQDGDPLTMRLCGLTVDTMDMWDWCIVLCERSRFSFEMQGDVGEYLVHSYSSSIAPLGSHWSMRLGNVGNATDIDGRPDSIYGSLEVLVNDVALAAGNGISYLTLDSLPSFLDTFGPSSLSMLRNAIDEMVEGTASYTFRIYAFRAVFMAIDAFDILML